MKVALVADPLWLMQELTTLRRLVVGLVDEQVGVVRVLPEWYSEPEEMQSMAGDRLWYGGSRWRFWRDLQLTRVALTMKDIDLDLIHVMDGSLQTVGRRMAATLEVPLVVSVWSKAEAQMLKPHADGPPTAYLAATPALVEACRTSLGQSASIDLVPVGIYMSDIERGPLSDPTHALSCLVVGDGRADGHYQSLLEGMAKVRDQFEQAMYFFYTVASDQHLLWKAAEKLGLLEQVSIVPFEPGSRALLVQADAVIQPQPLGSVRSLVLEAMAAGRPVISIDDPYLDYLHKGECARLLTKPTADDWAACLLELVREPGRMIDMGRAAREYVQTHHPASKFVTGTLQRYRQMTTPENIPFVK
ncbi:MAG: glycosyltransferase [Planctomycetes bacterium]|nr:glycosyltransferase [Planctomycetota bacterium]